MCGRCLSSLLLAVIWTAFALAADSGSRPLRDDLTTDYAKQVIRLSKVAEMKSMLKTQIAPCDDFYNYACGNWHQHNPAQLFQDIMTDTFQVISKGFDRRLRRLLQSPQTNSKLEQTLQSFFQSCVQARSDDAYYKLALKNIYREYGELPVLEGERWNAAEFSWWRTVAQIQHKYNREIILSVVVMPDIKNNTLNAVYVSPPDNDKLGNSHILIALEEAQLTDKLMQSLGLSSDVAKQTAREMNELERKLFKGSVSNSGSLADELTLYTLSELQQKCGSALNLTEFLALVLGQDNVPERLYVYSDSYLSDMLRTLQTTSSTTIGNYVLWQLLQDYLIDTQPGEMSKWCVDKTKEHFGKLADHMIYERYRSAAAEAEVHSMWQQIRGIFRQQLEGDKFDWITNQTRQLAIEKLDRMHLNINAYDNENFEALYGDLSMDRTNYVANVRQLLSARANRTLARLHQPPTSLEATDILSFTPAYSILANNISFPVALLQPNYFWGVNYPHALKYATLGYLLAHEMIHGFDDDGFNYDALGNQHSWWDEKSLYEFEEKRKCFQAQYHAYQYGGTALPESYKQSENIADNAGIKLAYAAYQRWLSEQPAATVQLETLPGLELNNRQLFFVAFAQIWCGDVQTLFKKSVALADEHAPGKYRVIGSLSNFQEFSWVYNCSQKAPMDPEFKCAIY